MTHTYEQICDHIEWLNICDGASSHEQRAYITSCVDSCQYCAAKFKIERHAEWCGKPRVREG